MARITGSNLSGTATVNGDGETEWALNVSAGSGASSQQVQGNVANGVADTGNPIKVGGVGASTAPTAVTAGQRTNGWMSLNGATASWLVDGTGAVSTLANLSADGLATGGAAQLSLSTRAFGYVFNGANWDRLRGDTNGAYVISKGGGTITTGQVAVATSATLVVAARTGRQKVTLTSTSAVVFYVGAAGVTAANGLYVAGAAGASVTLDTAAAVYAIGASAVTVSYAEFY